MPDPVAWHGRQHRKVGVIEKQLEKAIVVVSGLPRSGTSMMMQALAAGGLPTLTDHQRQADDSNPRGYFELEAVKQLPRDGSFLDAAEGHAVKIIHALLRHLPPGLDYRVIFMMREVDKVVASQRAMLERQGKAGAAIGDDRLTTIFTQQRDEALAWLDKQANIQTLPVDYAAAVADPTDAMKTICRFLDMPLAVDKMTAAVAPQLRRHV